MTAERPRDGLGRPLPWGSDPLLAGPPVPDVSSLTDSDVWELALDFLERGMPFHAHEVFEQRWRTASPGARPTWQALAQWTAALTHEARGNRTGARAVGRAALERLEKEGTKAPACVDVEAVKMSCRALGGLPDDLPA